MDDEDTSCEDENGKYEFINIDLPTTLTVRFMSKKEIVLDRCYALKIAFSCINNIRN